jgi:hypothetical protein
MNRETLMGRLLWFREMRLREEVAQLKTRAAALAQIERTRDQACASAVAGSGVDLRDLGLIGEVRLDSTKSAQQAAVQLRVAGDRVDHAHKQADAVRGAHDELQREKRLSRDRAQEHDSDQFQSWKRGAAPRR